MTAVADSTKQYCINAYGPNNRTASISSTDGIKEYLCPGATIGSAIGGTVPTAPLGTNLVPGFSAWTPSRGMSYDAANDEMVCDNTSNGSATSPLIRVDGASAGSFDYDGMATVATATNAYSGVYSSSSYFAANGTTGALNTSPSPGPYSSNGYASALAAPFASWQRKSMVMQLGPNVIYVRVMVNCDPKFTSDTHYRKPTYVVK